MPSVGNVPERPISQSESDVSERLGSRVSVESNVVRHGRHVLDGRDGCALLATNAIPWLPAVWFRSPCRSWRYRLGALEQW